ncbi:MAG: NADH-quinone oxidoreductase subunit M [Alphaproteobacteria bacterium]|nr:NADH-quinone oxidoreductase subunit M [Alphaproteobacteria bacterium]
MHIPLLSLIIFLPLVGVFFISTIKVEDQKNARLFALWISFVTFIFSIFLWIFFDPDDANFQFVESHAWIADYGISYHIGIDGLSLFFVLLSTFLTPLCILASWNSIQKRIREFMAALLLLEALLLGAFCAIDVFLFYIFFEGVLIPLFLIIGVWGGDRRVYASFKFFLFTLLGSVFMLLALMKFYTDAEIWSGVVELSALKLSLSTQKWIWWGFFLALAVKIPMWPVHTWLPDAHVEAPTAGSAILAGVLLKLGGYGFLRFSIALLPEASHFYAPFIMSLSVIGIIYTSLIALVQTDIKKIVAYSSVAHMGYVTLGIFTLTVEGVTGAVIQMISHGLVSAALFFCVGILYDRFHTRDISFYGGLVKIMPLFSVFLMIFILASIGLPGTSGFVGEFLTLAATFNTAPLFAFLAVPGIVLSAAYGLWLYKRLCFGKLSSSLVSNKPTKDVTTLEKVILGSLAALVLWIGIYPMPILTIVEKPVIKLLGKSIVQKTKTADF